MLCARNSITRNMLCVHYNTQTPQKASLIFLFICLLLNFRFTSCAKSAILSIMRITLLAINSKYVHSSLAVWQLASGVATHCRQEHDVSVLEATVNQSVAQIAEQIMAQQPDVLGISTYIWNAHMLPQLFALLRAQLPKTAIVLGGPEATHNAAYWLEQGADHVINGAGEQQFAALLDDYIAATPVASLDPYSEEYFHALGGRIAYIETSRGCPFRCTYCLSGESKLEFVPLDLTKAQIAKLARSGTRTIKFVDRTFNANAQRACDIWEYILTLNSDCCFHFEVAADLFDEQSLQLLSRVAPGKIQLEIGLQSFHEPTLVAVQRKTNLEKAQKSIRRLVAMGNIHVHVDLIAGLPEENLATFAQSFNRAYALGTHKLQLGFLKLLHGSKLRGQAQSLGLVYHKEPPYELISSPWLSEDDLQWLKTAENALQHTYNQGRLLGTLEYVLAATKLSPLELFYGMGQAVPHHATPLVGYTTQLAQYFIALPNVKKDILHDHLCCDLLRMTRGQCMPDFLQCHGKQRKQVQQRASEQLGRPVCAKEVAVLTDGCGVYIDSMQQNPVTGLYTLNCLR